MYDQMCNIDAIGWMLDSGMIKGLVHVYMYLLPGSDSDAWAVAARRVKHAARCYNSLIEGKDIWMSLGVGINCTCMLNIYHASLN